MASILFTKELHKRVVDSRITTYVLHPGVVRIDRGRSSRLLKVIYAAYERLFRKTAVEGAQTTIYCATQEGLEKHSSGYFSDC